METHNICNSIEKSTLYDNPFYHLYINNFFTNEFYLNILKYLPTKDQYIQINKTKSVSKNYSDERFILNITPDTFKIFYPDQKNFFRQVVSSLMSVEFFNSVIRKFNDKIIGEIPIEALSSKAPIYDRKCSKRKPQKNKILIAK